MGRTLIELAIAYGQAWADHDPAAIAELHTEDSVFHLHDVAPPAVGREAVRNLAAVVLAESPDLAFETRRFHLGTDHFVTEYVMTGTGQGKRFAIDGADIFTIADGLVARKDSYLDWLTGQAQLGYDPAARLRELLTSRSTLT